MEMSKSNWAVSSKISSQQVLVFPEFDAAALVVGLISSMAMTLEQAAGHTVLLLIINILLSYIPAR